MTRSFRYSFPPSRYLLIRESPPPPPVKLPVGDPELTAKIARMVRAKGGAERALEVVLTENREYRERHRTDTQDLETIRKKVPAEGSLVLSPDQVKVWEAFNALKLTPEKITESLAERDSLKLAVAEAADKELVITAATGEDYKFKPTVLAKLLKDSGMVIELKDVQKVGEDGKTVTVKVAYVRPSDPKSTVAPRALKEYAEAELKDWLPSLKAEDAPQDEGTHTFVPQRGGPGANPPPPRTTTELVKRTIQAPYVLPSERKQTA